MHSGRGITMPSSVEIEFFYEDQNEREFNDGRAVDGSHENVLSHIQSCAF